MAGSGKAVNSVYCVGVSDGMMPWRGDAEWVCVLSPQSLINFSAVDTFRACPRLRLVLSLPMETKVVCESGV